MKGAFPTGTEAGSEHEKKPRFNPPTVEELAQHFPQLEVLEFIGQGGMGAVYKARQKQLDRIVALKILPPQVASGPGFAERFTREARALAKLNHPHIVTLYEFGQTDGLFYFLMEFVDGINLRQLLNASRIAPKEALAIVPQICDALQFAHERGIVHRDIKPENILLSKDGQVKIADFGVAKIIAQDLGETSAEKGAFVESGELTEAGSVLGTPQYMAPEQVAHPLEVDHRADIYSLGVVFYQMLTGELPTGKFEPPSKKVVIDVRLDEVVLRALEKKPALRYQQVSEVKTMVETIATTSSSSPEVTTATVEHAVAVVSECAEGDPRLAQALQSLRPLNQSQVVKILAKHLESATDTIRRAAIYILWKGGFDSIEPSVASLQRQLSHPENFTRGMAALALGQNQIAGSRTALEAMTKSDKDDYARRLAVIALGLLGNARDAAPDAVKIEPRFSRMAIVGAVWAAFALVAAAQPFLEACGVVLPAGSSLPANGQWLWLLLRIVPALGCTAFFGTTILGWIAVAQIRRSAGKLYGLGLAVFDGLLFPLFMLDAVLISLPANGFAQADLLLVLTILLALAVIVCLDIWIIRAVWRAVNKPLEGLPTVSPTKDSSGQTLAWVALFFAGLSGVLGIVAFCLFPNPPEVLVWSILAMALLGIFIGIQTRKARTGKQAIVVGSIDAAIWLVVALAVNSTPFQIHLRELAHLNQWPDKVAAQTIQHEVGRQLREAGATYDDLQVSVSRDSGWPYRVSYRGLQNFKGADGTIPDANGEFIMQYIGGGQWQGALAGTQFTVNVGSQDKIDLPFVNDPSVIGEWESVDFVVHASNFNPDKPNPAGDRLFLKGLTFLENGEGLMLLENSKMPLSGLTWTKGMMINHDDKTASHYEIREINGKSYMFYEWKSGDVTISGMKPFYYVLKKTSSTGALAAGTNAFIFGPVIERGLPCDDSDPTDMLDLDSGKIVKSTSSDPVAPSTVAGIFYSQPASQLIASPSAVFQPIPGDDWESLTAQAAIAAIGKLAFTPVGRREYVPVDQLPETIIFKTRAGGMGVLQITGLAGNYGRVNIRYKLVQQIEQP